MERRLVALRTLRKREMEREMEREREREMEREMETGQSAEPRRSRSREFRRHFRSKPPTRSWRKCFSGVCCFHVLLVELFIVHFSVKKVFSFHFLFPSFTSSSFSPLPPERTEEDKELETEDLLYFRGCFPTCRDRLPPSQGRGVFVGGKSLTTACTLPFPPTWPAPFPEHDFYSLSVFFLSCDTCSFSEKRLLPSFFFIHRGTSVLFDGGGHAFLGQPRT